MAESHQSQRVDAKYQEKDERKGSGCKYLTLGTGSRRSSSRQQVRLCASRLSYIGRNFDLERGKNHLSTPQFDPQMPTLSRLLCQR